MIGKGHGETSEVLAIIYFLLQWRFHRCLLQVIFCMCITFYILSHTHKEWKIGTIPKNLIWDSYNLWSSSPSTHLMLESLLQPFLSSAWPPSEELESHSCHSWEQWHTRQIIGEPPSLTVMYLWLSTRCPQFLSGHWRPYLKTSKGSANLTWKLNILRI